MGVQGLWKEVSNQHLAPTVFSDGLVLVDYYAWFFWFLETFLPGQKGTAQQLLSCSYVSTLRIADCWIKACLSVGLEPVFIVDGSAGTNTPEAFNSKLSTWKERRNKTYQDHRVCEEALEAANVGDDSTPLLVKNNCPFAKLSSLLRRSLKFNKRHVFCCNGEADTNIDILSEHNNVAFVITNDTDLMLMPNCRVLFIQDAHRSPIWAELIRYTHELFDQKQGMSPIKTRTVYLRTAETTAAVLGLRSTELPLLALLRGTEHTRTLAPLHYGRFPKTLDLMYRLPKQRYRVTIDDEEYEFRDSRCPFGMKNWTHEHEQVFAFLCRFYRVIVTQQDLKQVEAVVSFYTIAQEELANARAGRFAQASALSMATAQQYAEVAQGNLLEYFTMLQVIEMPSFVLSVVGPNHYHFTESCFDAWATLPAPANVPLAKHTYNLRRRLYGLLLQDQRSVRMKELWSSDTASDIKTVEPIFPPPKVPRILKIPFMNDIMRYDAYKEWLLPHKSQPLFGAAVCSLATLYRTGDIYGRAALVAAILQASWTNEWWFARALPNCFERRLGIVTPPNRPTTLCQKYTLSEPGNKLVSNDLVLLNCPEVLARTCESSLETYETYLDDCRRREGLDKIPLVELLIPPPDLLSIWSRLVDYYEHLVWAQYIFLMSQHAAINMEYFFDFHLFVLVYEYLDIGMVYVSTGLHFVHEDINDDITRVMQSSKFASIESVVKSLGACLP
eukprot:Blabericola_migrator_1__339@NODE_1086_length_5491_cov_174_327065_g744_i0_p1_GENE_NODE_1086_length_5491_cov_174_327065_g744_i0NODE_1086_length_5491_cov_174_327065_g744_i0_p1_ORF_typecomplete_len728_score106_84XPG_I_2/PF12813_7/5_8e07XPG_N/PF00752_17/0_00062XPG_N/PF00752_17/1_4e04XPG_I/PF00867_18/0_0023XPG_I/PF00867_18/5_4e03_NODE_1086_length_5491_cov_174_327065_g744_i04522635